LGTFFPIKEDDSNELSNKVIVWGIKQKWKSEKVNH
jgi:hypothetical protein